MELTVIAHISVYIQFFWSNPLLSPFLLLLSKWCNSCQNDPANFMDCCSSILSETSYYQSVCLYIYAWLPHPSLSVLPSLSSFVRSFLPSIHPFFETGSLTEPRDSCFGQTIKQALESACLPSIPELQVCTSILRFYECEGSKPKSSWLLSKHWTHWEVSPDTAIPLLTPWVYSLQGNPESRDHIT